jgi:hypothetical protein
MVDAVDAISRLSAHAVPLPGASRADVAAFDRIAGAGTADVYVASPSAPAPFSIDGIGKQLVGLSDELGKASVLRPPEINEATHPLVAQAQIASYSMGYLMQQSIKFSFAVKAIETIQKSFETLYKLQG